MLTTLPPAAAAPPDAPAIFKAIQVSDVVYDAEIPDEVFDAARLRETASHPLWSKPPK